LTSKVEEELRKLSVEMRILEQTAETLQSRINMVNAAITDLTYASKTLEGLEKEKEKSELLIPIGGSSYIRAKLENPDKVIVGMGAGVSVEKTLQEAKEILKKRMDDLEKARASLQQQFSQVANRMNQDKERFDVLANELRLKSGLSGLVNKITTTELKAENLRPILAEFKINLIENDVAVPVAERICEEMEKRLDGVQVKRLEDRKKIVRENLREVLLETMLTNDKIDMLKAIEEKRRRGEPFVIVFVGINGTGKTTTIAKIANFLTRKGYSVVLACSDTYRAGSIEQLEEHAKRLGVKMVKHKYGADPAAVAYDTISHAKAHGINVVLIDTAGRIQTNRNLMNELAKIKRIVKPDLTVLTVDSLTGNDAVMQAEEFQKSVGIDATILTKVDADVKGGSAISVTYITKKPVLFIGTGQKYEDLEEFKPEKFVSMILR